jgi:hypothetical protein
MNRSKKPWFHGRCACFWHFWKPNIVRPLWPIFLWNRSFFRFGDRLLSFRASKSAYGNLSCLWKSTWMCYERVVTFMDGKESLNAAIHGGWGEQWLNWCGGVVIMVVSSIWILGRIAVIRRKIVSKFVMSNVALFIDVYIDANLIIRHVHYAC